MTYLQTSRCVSCPLYEDVLCSFKCRKVALPKVEHVIDGTYFWPDDTTKTTIEGLKDILGTVGDTKHKGQWKLAIELFLGGLWSKARGDFRRFVRWLAMAWFEEWLHVVLRCYGYTDGGFVWRSEEEPTRRLVSLMLSGPRG